MFWNRKLTIVSLFVSLALVLRGSDAFSSHKSSTSKSKTALHATTSRRMFVDVSVATLGAAFVTGGLPSPAFADFDDLAMPSEEEDRKAQEDAMAERLRRKAELQKAKQKPGSFSESLQKEMARKEEMKKQTKEDRRNALCEELGRGC